MHLAGTRSEIKEIKSNSLHPGAMIRGPEKKATIAFGLNRIFIRFVVFHNDLSNLAKYIY